MLSRRLPVTRWLGRTPKFLDVDVQQIAWGGMFVAH